MRHSGVQAANLNPVLGVYESNRTAATYCSEAMMTIESATALNAATIRTVASTIDSMSITSLGKQ
jgi:hypothetical protein